MQNRIAHLFDAAEFPELAEAAEKVARRAKRVAPRSPRRRSRPQPPEATGLWFGREMLVQVVRDNIEAVQENLRRKGQPPERHPSARRLLEKLEACLAWLEAKDDLNVYGTLDLMDP